MKKPSYEKFFTNFSNKTRLRIITSLMEGPLSVSDISAKTGEEQTNISHNLGGLVRCNLLRVKKDGKKRIYSLNKRTVGPIIKLVEQHTSECGDCSSCRMCG
jgi:ArsR family transcriptional regulator, lead/cadmium/zinc/bismuth-responsive transcriptional repressor